jgi:D-alanine transaminase
MASALPIAYLNGAFLTVATARISPLDRGFLFGDAVYEVIPVYGGRPLLLDAHLQRLARSLREVRITPPHDAAGWRGLISGLIERNGGGDMSIYLQVSRGADAGRDHVFPASVPPTVFGLASPVTRTEPGRAGIAAITAADIRWARCDIKSTSLLPNILLRQAAAEAGASEVILLRDGYVTEGSASSVIIVEQRMLVTRPNGPEILPGTTIRLIHDLALECGYAWREEPVAEDRLRGADEVWVVGAIRGISPVTRIDGEHVGAGVPGPVWRMVAERYELCKGA